MRYVTVCVPDVILRQIMTAICKIGKHAKPAVKNIIPLRHVRRGMNSNRVVASWDNATKWTDLAHNINQLRNVLTTPVCIKGPSVGKLRFNKKTETMFTAVRIRAASVCVPNLKTRPVRICAIGATTTRIRTAFWKMRICVATVTINVVIQTRRLRQQKVPVMIRMPPK